MPDFEVTHVTIHGHDVCVRTAGSGPVLLLVHGMAGSSNAWRHVMPALAERFTVVAPDLLGHGASAKPRTDYSLGAFASGLRDVLAALGHERATLVGQSLGGGIVMQFAYQFPERCERIVLVSSGGLGDEVNMLLRLLTLPGVDFLLPIACTTWLHDAGANVSGWLRRVGLGPGAHFDEVWDAYGSLSDAQTRSAFLQTLRSVIDASGQRVSALDRLYLASAIPTMIVWGDHDAIIPVHQAYETHEAIKGSRLEIFENVGHFPHCERPEQFVHVLVDFLNSTSPASVGSNLRELLRGAVS
ncbi:MAG: Alpha/beta hydrolase [Actinomycetia bacterium]|nr:Alpha/beta hydrolase [Actinomycetes bacterium]